MLKHLTSFLQPSSHLLSFHKCQHDFLPTLPNGHPCTQPPPYLPRSLSTSCNLPSIPHGVTSHCSFLAFHDLVHSFVGVMTSLQSWLGLSSRSTATLTPLPIPPFLLPTGALAPSTTASFLAQTSRNISPSRRDRSEAHGSRFHLPHHFRKRPQIEPFCRRAKGPVPREAVS